MYRTLYLSILTNMTAPKMCLNYRITESQIKENSYKKIEAKKTSTNVSF